MFVVRKIWWLLGSKSAYFTISQSQWLDRLWKDFTTEILRQASFVFNLVISIRKAYFWIHEPLTKYLESLMLVFDFIDPLPCYLAIAMVTLQELIWIGKTLVHVVLVWCDKIYVFSPKPATSMRELEITTDDPYLFHQILHGRATNET